MGTPSSLPINPNPSPSPPFPQSPPPQTLPLPQSPPPQSPPLPPDRTPTLIPPTPLSPQTEPQNEIPILDTHSPEPMPEPVPTQTKTKGKTQKAAGRPKKTPVGKRKRVPFVPFDLNSPPQPSSEPVSKRTRSSSQIPAPAVQTPVSQSPLNSPAAPASFASDIEEQHPEATGIADPTTFAPAEPQPTTTPQFSADILSLLRSLESRIASFTVQPSVPSPDTTEILATLKSLEVKIDTMG
ncbi:extensin-like [Hevea brasiliensis]|uniref:extensin-like n=1 Tax=Hevea brasiliensis TaxID=3981 RepID=UPI0025FA8CF8|nr:extensin-like [Hevea brasiliensis]